MDINRAYLPPAPPALNWAALPPEELDAGRTLAFNLYSLSTWIHELAAAVALFEHGQKVVRAADMKKGRPIEFQWMFVGARDGAMTIYHFAKAMEAVRGLFNRCPTWKPLVDHKILRQTVKDFERHFPFVTELRHGIAHAAEQLSTPEKWDAVSGGKTMIQNSLNGDVFHSTFEGQLVAYRVNGGTILLLIDAARQFYKAFAKLAPQP